MRSGSHRLTLLLAAAAVATGCTRQGFGRPLADAIGPDTTRDAAPLDAGAGEAPPCNFGRGNWRLADPEELTALNSGGSDADLEMLADGLTVVFGSNRDSVEGTKKIYTAQRATPSAPFGEPTLVAGLDGPGSQTSLSQSHDRLAALLVSNHGPGSTRQVYRATRATATVQWSLAQFVASESLNVTGQQAWDATLSPDGLTVHFAPSAPLGALAVAHRPSVDDDFGPYERIAELDSPGRDADPALTRDQRVIVFASDRSGGAGDFDLWYAIRASPTASFSAPQPLPQINTVDDDREPYVSPDGCELYFASDRPGGPGGHDLYRVRILDGP